MSCKTPKELMTLQADEWILVSILRRRSGCNPRDTVHYRIIGIDRTDNRIKVVKRSPIFKTLDRIPGNYPDPDYHASDRQLHKDDDFKAQLIKMGVLMLTDRLVRKPKEKNV